MSSLYEAIEGIKDPRSKHGQRHPLRAIIILLISGLLSGRTGIRSIVRWGRDQTEATWHAMGFTRRPPCAGRISTLLQELDTEQLQEQLQGWLKGLGDQGHHLALDGKTVRGSGVKKNEKLHLLSLFCSRSHLVLKDTDMQEGENEITAAIRLLKNTEIKGKVITGDAIFAQKKSVKP